MLKKILLTVVIIMVMMSANVYSVDKYAGYNVPVDIEINGNFIKCAHKPIMINNTTYIPLRAFCNAIGGNIEWNESEKTAIMTKDGHFFVFYPYENYCIIDGIKKHYSTVIYKGLTFISVRAVSEVLNYGVNWDSFYLTVKISAPGVTVPENCVDKSYTYEDILYLGKITHIECGQQRFDVKLGVAGTVVNRFKSSGFPDSIKEVVLDTRYSVQFPPAHTDRINITPSMDTMIAAKCALGGVNLVRNAIYFIDVKSAASSWVHNNRLYYTTIDTMSFYE